MRGVTRWDYHPYIPLERKNEKNWPYICHVAPAMNSIAFEILDNDAPDAPHLVMWRKAWTEDAWELSPMVGTEHTIEGLEADCDYEFAVVREAERDTNQYRVRYARTGFYPDTMVNYLHPKDDIYAFSGTSLCSPSIIRCPSGALLTSMDVFAPCAPQNLTLIFRSEDNGKTWHYVCDLFPAFWGTLFVHRGVVYMLATTTEQGHVVIGASYDEGFTWTKPTLLFVGSAHTKQCGMTREPMPVITHNGYLRTSIDYGGWAWSDIYMTGTLSIKEDADLLVAENWTCSELIPYDMSWEGSPKGGKNYCLEGSLYQAKDGKLIDLLRMGMMDSYPNYGKACLLEIDPDDIEAAPKFHSIIDMPTGTNSRTHVLYDAVSDKYWAIGNLCDNPNQDYGRTVMTLCVSDDGYAWRKVLNILDYSHMDIKKVGFQYMSFIFDGDDILYVSRTAFNEAENHHNANCQTFGVVKNFRSLA